ncbi:MAG: hypothetical protein AVDCRST_MAG93-5124 [uncultured Chloroflexia bacterium]|uniref:Uncharacterized protein n=1 Tax=uncultured Chloroflexia bacterium TaxID=1672391 RepID=A0A6J4KN17_9CHLR|nr:MAG: hypothetical protein AVDCRST_MAG93-5124 [uncultured Chloroflexia bacterium]
MVNLATATPSESETVSLQTQDSSAECITATVVLGKEG